MSGPVVKQREEGIQEFLTVMIALADISDTVGEEFFTWLGWAPESFESKEESLDGADAGASKEEVAADPGA